MKRVFYIFVSFCLFLFSPLWVQVSSAADVRANNTVIITSDEKNLNDLYLFGNTVRVDAPVNNDVVAAGQDVSISNIVSGGVLAAGANVTFKGTASKSVRMAGGNVIIDGKVGRDLVVAGGNVTITKTATVTGDVLAAGGQLTLDGTVDGKLVANGGQVEINGTVGKNVEGNMGQLRLGSNAVVNGDLNYSSTDKAIVASGAVIHGTEHFNKIEKPEKAQQAARTLITAGSIYKLFADIIVSVLFIVFLGQFLVSVLGRIAEKPIHSGALGLAFFVVGPVVSLILLIFAWLGAASFLFYFLALLFGLFGAKILLGWLMMRWFEGQNKREYLLDWKAGVIGPITYWLIMLIPIIGWIANALLFLAALGGMIWEFSLVLRTLQLPAGNKAPRKK